LPSASNTADWCWREHGLSALRENYAALAKKAASAGQMLAAQPLTECYRSIYGLGSGATRRSEFESASRATHSCTPIVQCGRLTPKVAASLVQSRRELAEMSAR
jgi:hypothetical protein